MYSKNNVVLVLAVVALTAGALWWSSRGLDAPSQPQPVAGPLFNASTVAVYEGTHKPEQMVLADFDGDALLDLAFCNSYHQAQGGDVSVYFGEGGGKFGRAHVLAVGANPEGLAVGDFNGDDRPDLASADYGSDSVSILLNAGRREFAAATGLAVAGGPRDVLTLDVNGDAKLDLVTANYDGESVSVFHGGGDGRFTIAQSLAARGTPEVIRPANFDGDEHVDFATANHLDNSVTILHGVPGGTLEVVEVVPVPRKPRFVYPADLDGDGLDDFFCMRMHKKSVPVFRNLGAGKGFELAGEISTGEKIRGVYAQLVDVDGDGLRDIVGSFYIPGRVAIFPGRGGFEFGASQDFEVGKSAMAVRVADLNADGSADFLVANTREHRVQVYLAD